MIRRGIAQGKTTTMQSTKYISKLRSSCLLVLLLVFTVIQVNVEAQTGIKIGLVADIVYSPDGSKIAVAAGPTICTDESDHVIKIIDVASQTELQSLEGHRCPVLSVAWKPDGTELASTGQDSIIRIWDLATGETRQEMKSGVSPDGQFSLEWSPDGSKIVHLFGGVWIIMWDTSTGDELFAIKGHTGTINDVEWSPDGSQLASGASDDTI